MLEEYCTVLELGSPIHKNIFGGMHYLFHMRLQVTFNTTCNHNYCTCIVTSVLTHILRLIGAQGDVLCLCHGVLKKLMELIA
jgi:hypothetical protein